MRVHPRPDAPGERGAPTAPTDPHTLDLPPDTDPVAQTIDQPTVTICSSQNLPEIPPTRRHNTQRTPARPNPSTPQDTRQPDPTQTIDSDPHTPHHRFNDPHTIFALCNAADTYTAAGFAHLLHSLPDHWECRTAAGSQLTKHELAQAQWGTIKEADSLFSFLT